MKLYLAGPMRGHALNNFPAFDAAANTLRASGHTVWNPADHDRAMGLDEHNDCADVSQFHEMFRWDLERVMDADAVVFLTGWQKSRGACAERTVAHYLGTPCFDIGPEGALVRQPEFCEPEITWTEKHAEAVR